MIYWFIFVERECECYHNHDVIMKYCKYSYDSRLKKRFRTPIKIVKTEIDYKKLKNLNCKKKKPEITYVSIFIFVGWVALSCWKGFEDGCPLSLIHTYILLRHFFFLTSSYDVNMSTGKKIQIISFFTTITILTVIFKCDNRCESIWSWFCI